MTIKARLTLDIAARNELAELRSAEPDSERADEACANLSNALPHLVDAALRQAVEEAVETYYQGARERQAQRVAA